jgi:hypothetical protein
VQTPPYAVEQLYRTEVTLGWWESSNNLRVCSSISVTVQFLLMNDLDGSFEFIWGSRLPNPIAVC